MGWRLAGLLLLALVHARNWTDVTGQEHAPCFNCELYKLHHHEDARKGDQSKLHHHENPMQGDQSKLHHHEEPMQGDQSRPKECLPSCQCPLEDPECMDGIKKVKDGCGCCLMCPRQLGDVCSRKHVCDKEKGLYCDIQSSNGRAYGFCRARSAKSCEVDGVTYKDEATFNRGCREVCTCQNGRYGCSPACPHENMRPSSTYCPHPELVAIEGECCKEWACPTLNSETTQTLNTATAPMPTRQCKKEVSNWSSCSVSCGMGVSIRISNENPDCVPKEEKRLCVIRPCDLDDKQVNGKECKRTFRTAQREHVTIDDCKSSKLYILKYCGTCRHNKCCLPDKSKTKTLQFYCNNGTRLWKDFMWVKSCTCFHLDKCPHSAIYRLE